MLMGIAPIDIGVNLTHASFHQDREAIVERARKAGVSPLIATGTSERISFEAHALTERWPGLLFSTAGIHPHHAKDCSEQTLNSLRSLLSAPSVVAVGECGLDFNRDFSPRPIQEKWFGAQIELALELKLPLFLHERDAHDRFTAIVRERRADVAGGVVHCFTGNEKELDAYLELGFFIGITGWICDERRGKHLLELVRRIPAERLLLETDAPFLIPRSLRPRPWRNEPCFLPHILYTVAKATGRQAADVAAQSREAAFRCFPKLRP